MDCRKQVTSASLYKSFSLITIFHLARAIRTSQTQRGRCVLFSASWQSGGIKSRLCGERQPVWKPFAPCCTAARLRLILDLHVEQIFCIPLQGLCQQSQERYTSAGFTLESCARVLSPKDNGCLYRRPLKWSLEGGHSWIRAGVKCVLKCHSVKPPSSALLMQFCQYFGCLLDVGYKSEWLYINLKIAAQTWHRSAPFLPLLCLTWHWLQICSTAPFYYREDVGREEEREGGKEFHIRDTPNPRKSYVKTEAAEEADAPFVLIRCGAVRVVARRYTPRTPSTLWFVPKVSLVVGSRLPAHGRFSMGTVLLRRRASGAAEQESYELSTDSWKVRGCQKGCVCVCLCAHVCVCAFVFE